MIYLANFRFPAQAEEASHLSNDKRATLYTYYDTYYPFGALSKRGRNIPTLDFDTVTILYGGNGSGKSTALNVIAEKLSLERDTLYNRSDFFEDYVDMCRYDIFSAIPDSSRIITSDDVFDFMLNLRSLNEGIDVRREELMGEYLDAKLSGFKMRSLDDYEQLKKVNAARFGTKSSFVRKNVMGNVREHSNGESAFSYFSQKIQENGLYLLDEPENSLSPARQLELMQFLEDSARFFGCQFIIATHSPFILSMKGAKIYDFDTDGAPARKWTELENVRTYFSFFKEHENDF